MGYQLKDQYRESLASLAHGKRAACPPHAYLLAFLSSAIEIFLRGDSSRELLEEAYRTAAALKIMEYRYDPATLDRFASGEIPLPVLDIL